MIHSITEKCEVAQTRIAGKHFCQCLRNTPRSRQRKEGLLINPSRKATRHTCVSSGIIRSAGLIRRQIPKSTAESRRIIQRRNMLSFFCGLRSDTPKKRKVSASGFPKKPARHPPAYDFPHTSHTISRNKYEMPHTKPSGKSSVGSPD